MRGGVGSKNALLFMIVGCLAILLAYHPPDPLARVYIRLALASVIAFQHEMLLHKMYRHIQYGGT